MNFTTEFTKLEKSQMRLSVTVKQEEVKNSYAALTAKYAKQLQLPGFRKGKVPIKILEQKFGESLRAETSNEVVESVLKEIFESVQAEQRPLPYAAPKLEDVAELSLEADFVFAVVYDIMPVFSLEKISGFTIEIPEVKISDGDIQKELLSLQERNALITDCSDTVAAEKGLIATLNLVELDEAGNEKADTKQNGYVFTLGSEYSHYDINDDVIGMKKNEEKTVVKSYPADYQRKEYAGTTKTIRVTLTALKKRDLPAIDDDLAQDVSEKYKTLADLKAAIAKSLTVKIEDELEKEKVQSLLTQIVESNPFELPESMVMAELEGRWSMLAEQMRISVEQLENLTSVLQNGKRKADIFQDWRADAELHLKKGLVLQKLLSNREITVSSEEVEAEYAYIAERRDINLDEVKKHYADDVREREYLIDSLKEKKLYTQLFAQSSVKTGAAVSVDKFFGKEMDDAGKDA